MSPYLLIPAGTVAGLVLVVGVMLIMGRFGGGALPWMYGALGFGGGIMLGAAGIFALFLSGDG